MYFHESVYGAVPSENWLRHLRAPGFGGLAEPVVLPRVTGDVFRNTGASSSDNCCALCPITLGVGVNGTGANGMEIVYTVSGHRAGFEYDILRTQRHSIWERVAGAWSRLGGQPMGTGDDQSSRDECLRPVGNRIFVVDRPGFNRPFPAADGLIIQGPAGRASTATATDIVLRASFAEWVITRNKALGVDWKAISPGPFLFWHTINWLTRNGANQWVYDAGRSEIERGSLSERVVNTAPGP